MTQTANEPKLLHAARAAMERRDFQHADGLFVEHLALARDDVAGLAEYGVFCLRTGRAQAACYLLHKANALRPDDSELLSRLGYAQIELPDMQAAQSSFEAALAPTPDHTQANYGLALCLRHRGDWVGAAAAFAKALTAQTDAFPILFNLADACHRAGDQQQARAHFASALRIAPDQPALLLAYGKFLREQGEPSAAMVMIDRCASRYPDEPGVILEKARCLHALGDAAHAIRWLDRLEKQSPGLPECAAEYGNCLAVLGDKERSVAYWLNAVDLWTRRGDYELAEAQLDRLLAANPASADGWNARGDLERAEGHLDAAEKAWKQAITLDPQRVDAHANLALLRERSNRLDDAKIVAEKGLLLLRAGTQQGGASELLLALSKVRRRQRDYAGAMELIRRIDAFAPDESQRMFAGFERGSLLDRLDDPSGAIAAFADANAIARTQWLRDHPGDNKYVPGIDIMLDLVGRGWLQHFKPVDALPATRNIAFLVGFPRSGTTLLNQVLDGHAAIHAMEEKPPVSKMMAVVRGMPGAYPHALPGFDALDIACLRDAYFRSAADYGATDPSKLLLDKFPMNIALAALLHRVFPHARFVFALRHPCDVVLSCFMQSFRLNDTMVNFCTLAETVALYTRTMDLWELYRRQLPLNVHTIRYEDVVDDFDGQIHALCAFLDVPWHDDMRQFAERALARGRIDTPSYEQVSRPIYREARYRWERYREHLAPFLPALQPYIERFGYADSTRSD